MAPPKRPPSRCLQPGLWAATDICQSPGAPYLERDMKSLKGRCKVQFASVFMTTFAAGGEHCCDLTVQERSVSEGTR